MDLMDVSIPLGNKLVSKYVARDHEVRSLFDYQNIESDEEFSNRADDLSNRSYPREELTNYLLEFHKKFDVNNQTINNIKRLQDPRSVVVIGGQQAGLLTGPLYTIHKIISIIKLAKEKEQNLNIPVIPVFWIAGEDHDFDEINHVYIPDSGKAKKVKITQRQYRKTPVSAIEIDKQIAEEWIEDVVTSFGETERTAGLLSQLYSDLQLSSTYVDFFIRLIYRLFPAEGLVVADSGDPGFREVGASFMQSLVHENNALREKVYVKQMALKESGFGEPIDLNEENAHFFYLHNGERVLLEKHGDMYVGKSNECAFTHAELLEVATTSPHLLSNNVVTRPLMQEFLFPTLAFISGPGEIAYWATLKEAFHLFGFKMPIILPRLMMSIVDRSTHKYVEDLHLDIKDVLLSGSQVYKEKLVFSHRPADLDRVLNVTIEKIGDAHAALKNLAVEIDKGLQPFAEKNADIIKSQILLLKDKMEKSIYNQHQVQIRKFDYIDLWLRPLDAPQERIWNVFYYINLYGFEFVDELMKLEFTWSYQHKVIYL